LYCSYFNFFVPIWLVVGSFLVGSR